MSLKLIGLQADFLVVGSSLREVLSTALVPSSCGMHRAVFGVAGPAQPHMSVVLHLF